MCVVAADAALREKVATAPSVGWLAPGTYFSLLPTHELTESSKILPVIPANSDCAVANNVSDSQ